MNALPPIPTSSHSRSANRQELSWMGSFGASSLLHVGLLLVSSTVWLSLPEPTESQALNSRWTIVDQGEIPEMVLPEEDPKPLTTNLQSGGSPLIPTPTKLSPLEITSAPTRPEADFAAESEPSIEDHFAEAVKPLRSSGTQNEGNGLGNGEGDGNQNAPGFFGINSQGKKFVFVVDCSQSMNHPHASPAKTRFRRLKLEMVSSIGHMTEDQEFFIIFFNSQAIPMPAQGMQPAKLEVKQQFLGWMAEVRAIGDTDPRLALGLALQLKPDVIYFLTDGDFEIPIRKDLLKLKQAQAVIHTYAFGDRSSEGTLKALAERNGGQFHFIP